MATRKKSESILYKMVLIPPNKSTIELEEKFNAMGEYGWCFMGVINNVCYIFWRKDG